MKRIAAFLLFSCLSAALVGSVLAGVTPPKVPATLTFSVAPTAVEPGGTARIELRLDPIEGVKINRYPKVRLRLNATDGIAAAGEVSIGESAPPPPGETAGYYEKVDPLALELAVDANAPSGRHTVTGLLNYVYCMPKKGFCAPARVPVEVALTVR